MIPGIQDYYDGMHHHIIHQMEQALEAVHPQGDLIQPGSHAVDFSVGDHGPTHSSGGHSPAADSRDAHREPVSPAPGHDQANHSWLAPIIHALGENVIEAATEMAADLIFSQIPLAASHAQHPGAPSLHVGTPHGDGFTQQTTGFTCAVVSQKMILDQFHLTDPRTGEPVSEAQLVYDATVHGWLTDHGTSLENLGKLLEHYEVSSHEGHDWKHLVGDLAAGHQVVIAVNADNLWNDHSPLTELANLFGSSPNHAIVLKGLKVDDHGHVVVVVNDPGRSDGAGVEYRLEHFQSAINSTQLQYVATDRAPPEWSPEHAIGQLARDYPDPGGQYEVHAAAHGHGARFTETVSHMDDVEKFAFLRSL